ncbi:Uncharacterized protein APZ42_005131, partial [Daphnia magna]
KDSRTTGFKQSKEDDTAVVPIKNVIQITKSFMRTSRRARSFKIESTERVEIEIKFSNMMANGVDFKEKKTLENYNIYLYTTAHYSYKPI